ncbi:N-acetylmuramoyl-L-alanine amidase [Microdochium nivale]|nr:N-acetylmuramoyl-L-alanine amidase [Microdochium nivale]
MLFNLAAVALLAVGVVATPAQSLNARQACSQGSHVVAPGETLSGLAAQFGSSVCAIAEANNIPNKNQIFPLQVLRIPLNGCTLAPDAAVCCIPSSGATTKRAVAGDTFFKLANQFGVSLTAIQAANSGVTANNIAVGATLNIPARGGNC